jgi:MalT-like TPR region
MNKAILLLSILLFRSAFLLGGTNKISYTKAVAFYQKEFRQHHQNHFLTSKALIFKWQKNDFPKESEWELFLEYCLNEVKTESEPNYYALCFDLGDNLSMAGYYQDALPFLFRIEEYLADKNPETVSYYYYYHSRMGMVYYNFKQFQQSKKYFSRLINATKAPVTVRINALNSIGLIYKSTKKNDLSYWYFKKALSVAKTNNREDWIGIISGNLGECYFLRNQLDEALPLTLIDYEKSCKSKEWESAMMATISIAKIDLLKNRFEAAKERLSTAEYLMKHYFHSLSVEQRYWETMALLHQKSGQYKLAYDAQQKYLRYLDTINEKEQLINFYNTQFQLEFQKKQTQIKLLESRRKRAEQILLFSIVIICCIIFGLFIVVRQIILKRRKEREVLTLQKLRAEDELKNVDSQMRLVLSNLSEKNNLIDQLQQEIEHFNSSAPTPEHSSDQIHLLDKLQSFKLLTSDDWDVFRKLFEKLHPGFFDRFEQLSEEITKADLRLAALICLKSSTNEMAKILGISIESVQRTHLRLRKKLMLEQAVDLERLIRSL